MMVKDRPSGEMLICCNMALVLEAIQSGERDVPDYIEMDAKGLSAKYIRQPELAEVPYPVKMEPNLIVEFYAS